MARLSLSLLGSFQVALDEEPLTTLRSDKVRALLAYLAVEADRPHRREKLAALLWPDRPERDARTNLRKAIEDRPAMGDRTRSKDRAVTPPFLHISRKTVQFNRASDACVDVTAFTGLLEAPEPTTGELEEAVALYRGEFLEGFSIADSVPFEEWMLLKREHLGRQVLSALHRLAATYESRGEYGRALPHAWRQVELEPWQEQTHRQLMRLLALNGQRGAALAQYEACRRALAEELAVEPAPETTRLYEQIRDGELSVGQAEGRPAEIAPVRAAAPSDEVLPPAQRRPSIWQKIGVRVALVGGGLLLLAIAIMQAISVFGTEREGLFPPPQPFAAVPEGKIAHLCEGVTPPQICVQEGPTGRITQVTNDLEFEKIDRFSWSPDGQQIVFGADCRLCIINADGSDLKQITNGDTADGIPVWSPDGQWIAFNRNRELWIVRPDGSEVHRLFGETEEVCTGELMWSPNSQQIAFVGQGCAVIPHPEDIWVVNCDGTDPQVLHSFERQPDYADVFWNPNGREIVCAHAYDGGEMKLLLIRPSGAGEPHMIDELPILWFPNFWPQWGGGK